MLGLDITYRHAKFDQSNISRSRDVAGAHQNSNGLHDLTTPLSGKVCHPWASTCYAVCLKIEIHEIHMPKYQNPPTMYEIHCLKIEIHKVHEIHSKATLAKYRNPQTVRNPHGQGSQQTNRQLL